ncbi:MAG: CAP domain-containing protein [Bacteroidetes bacterium]|nr:MAG: CAP domain-containing protein [Bacteroidota bacterium]
MKKFKTLVTVFLITQLSLLAQNEIYKSIPKSNLDKANTAKNVNYLSNSEKEVILYMNLARLDGSWFIEHIYNKKISFVNKFSISYRKSLVIDLKEVKDLPMLNPAKGLTKSARYHAKDMGTIGDIGHKSSDGTSTFVRIKKYAQGGYMAENCQYGHEEAIDIVLDLLIDDGISSLGHRKNILNSNFSYVGVAIEPHKVYRVNCVQDFSDTGD